MNDFFFGGMLWSEKALFLLLVIALMFILNVALRWTELYRVWKAARKRVDRSAKREASEKTELPGRGVSVIITVHNDLKAIAENMPFYLDQDYPDFEIVVVDEVSEDGTLDCLTRLAAKNERLHVSRLFPGVKFLKTKKIALNIGIFAAKYDLLLFADITCRPQSRLWIKGMAENFSDEVVAVAGSSVYESNGRILEPFRYLHNLHLLDYHFISLFKKPVDSDFANFGFRKDIYFRVKGYSKNNHEVLGFENEIQRKAKKLGKMVLCDMQETFLVNTSGDFDQKRNLAYYYSTRLRWPFAYRFLSDLPLLLQLLLAVPMILLLPLGVPLWFFLILLLFFFLTDIVLQNLIMRYMGQRKLFITSVFVSTFYPFIKFYYEINATFSRQTK